VFGVDSLSTTCRKMFVVMGMNARDVDGLCNVVDLGISSCAVPVESSFPLSQRCFFSEIAVMTDDAIVHARLW